VAAGSRWFGSAALLLAVSGLCDLLDGAIARAQNRTSAWGAILDSTFDRVSDAAPLIGAALALAPSRWLAVLPLLVLVAGYVVSYVRARAQNFGLRLDSTPMQRAERLVATMGCLLLGDLRSAGLPHLWLAVGFALESLLVGHSAWRAMAAARRAAYPEPRVPSPEQQRSPRGWTDSGASEPS